MLYRPLIALVVVGTILVCVLCVLLAVAATRSHDRLQVMRLQLEHLGQFEESARNAVTASLDEQRARLQQALAALARSRDALDEATATALGERFVNSPGKAIPWAERQRGSLDELMEKAHAEWWLMMILSALLGGGSLVLSIQLRIHFLKPLEMLNRLLTTISLRRYEAVETADINPALRPLFESYGELITRVANAREIQVQREAELRQELREATRVLMQQQVTLMRDQRMAANGELTAQIAHDLRNPLAGILAAVQNLREDIDNADHKERLDMVCDEVKRLARQLTGLVDSSRQLPEPAVVLNLKEVVESVMALASYQLPTGLALDADIPAEMNLRAPEGNLRQALLNLILNASNAMEGDTTGHIAVRARVEDGYVILSVTDTGPGFTDEALETGVRAFESFSRGGSGLGLAAVRRFIGDLGGRIELENAPDGGAQVLLYFPEALSND